MLDLLAAAIIDSTNIDKGYNEPKEPIKIEYVLAPDYSTNFFHNATQSISVNGKRYQLVLSPENKYVEEGEKKDEALLRLNLSEDITATEGIVRYSDDTGLGVGITLSKEFGDYILRGATLVHESDNRNYVFLKTPHINVLAGKKQRDAFGYTSVFTDNYHLTIGMDIDNNLWYNVRLKPNDKFVAFGFGYHNPMNNEILFYHMFDIGRVDECFDQELDEMTAWLNIVPHTKAESSPFPSFSSLTSGLAVLANQLGYKVSFPILPLGAPLRI